ncbi:MAG: M48 family metallopeptidase [Phycisphaeraceae bacterium]|nr:M48 family metallopeptidase [Phycisphaeraceae bacterium]
MRHGFTLGLVVLVVAMAGAGGCTTVEGSGRSQLNAFSLTEEKQLGAQAYPELLQGAKILTSGPQYERGMRVAKRIQQAAIERHPNPAAQFEWEWAVIDDDSTVNAWALPGGKCAMYTGIMKVASTDDELAVVLGHEAAHAIARHGGERMTQQTGINVGSQVAAVLGSVFGDPTGGMASGELTAAVLHVTVGLPYSRKHETEADIIGLMIAAQAGYDPRAAPGFWDKMGQLGGSKPPEFLSTHPADDTRAQTLQRYMPEAMAIYERSAKAPQSR